jgi:hypothetical protein
VWGTQSGYVFVPRRQHGNSGEKDTWDEGKAYKYPEEWDKVKQRIETSAKTGWDTYWCPLVFDKPARLKENAKPQQSLLWADLDFVDPTTLGALRPSIAWASSDTRYQGLWALDGVSNIGDIESVNRDLTYHIGADKGGWDVTQVLRVPGTPNFKYDPPQQGKMLWAEKRLFVLEKVKTVVDGASTGSISGTTSSDTIEDLLDGWKISQRAKDLLFADDSEVEVGERSDRLWEIETSLVEAGLPLLTIVEIIAKCPFNKFKGRRDEMNQIYKEVTKADVHVKQRSKGLSTHKELDPEAKKLKEQLWAVPFETLSSKKIEPPSWLVEGIWQKGTYGMIAGEPKTYKSVQATDLALSVASGRPFLNFFPVRTVGNVLYIQEENGENIVQDRINKIAAAKGLLINGALPPSLPIYFSNNYGINLTDEDSRNLIEETIQKINPILVVLDPLYMMLGDADENSAKEVGGVLRWLTYIRNQYNCTIVVCHHYNKGTGASTRGGQRVRGSSAFHGWVESALYVKVTQELYTVDVEREFRGAQKMPDYKVKVELGKTGELYYNTTVEISSGSGGIKLPSPTQSAADELRTNKLMDALSIMPRTKEELLNATGMSSNGIDKAIECLVVDGKVIKESGIGRGNRTQYRLISIGEEIEENGEMGIQV